MLHCLCCCCHNSYKRSRVAREKEMTLEGIAAGFIAFLPVQLLSRSFSPALYYYYYVFLSRVTLSKLGENTGRALRYDQKSFWMTLPLPWHQTRSKWPPTPPQRTQPQPFPFTAQIHTPHYLATPSLNRNVLAYKGNESLSRVISWSRKKKWSLFSWCCCTSKKC